MRKVLTALTVGIFLLGITGIARATAISFITKGSLSGLLGVDAPTSAWSTNNSTKNLGTVMWDLLGGTAKVTGYINGTQPGNLTHRGTRGLGVHTGEFDEVNNPESIFITFNQPQYLSYLEVRSLFVEPHGIEEGDVFGYLNGGRAFNQHLKGIEKIKCPGTNGSLAFNYKTPYIIDTLQFTVRPGQSYTDFSEFAVAKLEVEVAPVPEPISMVMLSSISLGIAAFHRLKRRRQK